MPQGQRGRKQTQGAQVTSLRLQPKCAAIVAEVMRQKALDTKTAAINVIIAEYGTEHGIDA